jgi:hemerythrin-like domain-containing protein
MVHVEFRANNRKLEIAMKQDRKALLEIALQSDQRYRLYREHKYITAMMDGFVRTVQKADFKDNSSTQKIKEKLCSLKSLMEGHADHENNVIHQLLRHRNVTIHESIELDHQDHQKQFKEFEEILDRIINTQNKNDKRSLGFAFYLLVRNFQQENLRHLNEEETIIMPKLQELYSDEELKQRIDFKTYAQMETEELFDMLQILFPVMNADDRAFFLNDIQKAEPEKFEELMEKLDPLDNNNRYLEKTSD